jgi:hypothetical protein
MLMDKNMKEIGMKINSMVMVKKSNSLLFMKVIFKMDLNMVMENLPGNKMDHIMWEILKMVLFKGKVHIIIRMEENMLEVGRISK